MKKQFSIIIALLWVSVLSARNLTDCLDSLLKESPFLRQSETGICVYDRTTGTYLYRYRDMKNARPASNQKLLTSVAALDVLGADYPFTTTLYCDKFDNLYIKGGFDPEFGDEDMNTLVNAVYDAGIRRVKGYLFGDVSMTDENYWGPGWAWDDTPASYQPYMSPLMFNKGCVEIVVSPKRNGSDNVMVYPASSYYRLVYTPSNAEFYVWRDWVNNKNVLYVGGSTTQAERIGMNLYSSRDFFMHTFAERLLNTGVRAKNVRMVLRESLPFEYVETPTDNVVALKTVSHPLSVVMTTCLKKSDNLNAEAMLRNYAGRMVNKKKEVTEKDGVAALRWFVLNKLRLNPDNYRIADGCGLSPYNALSPYLLVEVLKYATGMPAFTTFYNALPVAGIDGTLSRRMRGTAAENNVRAKTGSVTGVSTLSGYVTARNGHQLVFSIMNQNVTNSVDAKSFENKVCVLLSNWK